MKSLLIVEDEKMIRHGIATMAQRCSVEIEGIIECRNGEEALEILREESIDVMFTDIRMPKMDGIQLVKEIEMIKNRPDIVVISGYDDFNYAVEMLKHGVSDYILKPVKRDKIEEILVKLDAHRKESIEKEKDRNSLFMDLMRHILNSKEDNNEFARMEKYFKDFLGEDKYRILVLPGEEEIYGEFENLFYLDMDGQKVVIIRDNDWKIFFEENALNFAGISKAYSALSDCKTAYEEAYKARIYAFFSSCDYVEYTDKNETQEMHYDYEGFAEKFVSAFTTKDWERYETELLNCFFAAKHGKQNPFLLLSAVKSIGERLHKTYDHVISEDKQKLLKIQNPLQVGNINTFQEEYIEQLNEFHCSLEEQFVQDQNKRKIKQAIEYIKKNYDKDLNMAVVSNYVSMNYSLFSLSFKEYTGVNFVNFLKEIRINQAKALLENTDWKIQEIASKVGYENEKNFMKIFKNTCGISPTEYRRNLTIKYEENGE